MANSNTPIAITEGGDTPLETPTVDLPSAEELNIPEIRVQPDEEAQKSFNINEFRSEMNLNGVLRNNQFLVVLTPPKTLADSTDLQSIKVTEDTETIKDENGQDTENKKTIHNLRRTQNDTRILSLRCENASLPGVNFFSTDNIRRYGYGQLERRPYLPQFNPITLTFAVDKYGKTMKYFYDWAKSIVDYEVMKNGKHDGSYFLSYKDDYICKKMNIWIYNPNNKVVVQCSLRDAFPLTISDTNLSWGQQDDYVRLQVTLQYTDIQIDFASTAEAADSFAVLDGAVVKPVEQTKRDNPFKRLFNNKINDLEEKVVNKIFNIF